MPRQNKIEKHGCQEIVAAGLKEGKSVRAIAEECSEWAGEKISHTAVARYVETLKNKEQQQRKEVIQQDRRRVLKTVNQELDIIQLQYKTTEKLLERFELLDDLPEFVEDRLDELVNQVVEKLMAGEKITSQLEKFQAAMTRELNRKVIEITSLNRELRENSKFLADLRERAFEFSLVQEYLSLFMDLFKDADEEAYQVAIQKVAANPRMQKLVDQQMHIRGES
ncbi:hypothetical protein SAMN05421743_105208 [Thalassobacillus cyri]|uniref:Uncharacterized protein n=1 Tax=Thalassobacillus cyri TaxID=571932 RepID=A0A1H4BZK1_9BACI|nr:hypothetical protein [Thalassobacillus cyri]SEA53546.1 hypothetical protein SAMN05421743_105208 [Thalassobacillus cyri]